MKRILLAGAVGIIVTVLLTVIGLSQDSRETGCVFLWQACLVQLVVHTPENPLREGSVIDLFGFVLGVLAGVPIYSLISYGVLTLYARCKGGGKCESGERS